MQSLGNRLTPTDELSGLPLLLAPQDRALSILWECEPGQDGNGQPIADWDHAWHPGRGVIDGGFGGVGLRNSRVQFVLRHEQHNEKHAYYDGPPLPQRPVDRFRATVLCAAGYIPLRAIAFGTDGPYQVDLNDWQRTRLRESGEVRAASLSVVQKFLTEFVLSQPLDHIKPKTINQFLGIDPAESADAGKKHKELAYRLLSLAIDRVEDPLIRPYTIAHEHALLSPDAPPRPDWFIRSNIVRSRKNLRHVANEFSKRLAIYRDEPQSAARLGSTALVAA